jgi:Tol biopolymer transport system component
VSGRDGASIRLATYDLEQKTLTPIAAYRQEHPNMPVWFPDGGRLLLGRYGMQQGELVAMDVDGNEPPRTLATLAGTWVTPFSVSRDGRYATLSLLDAKTHNLDIWLADLSAPPSEAARPFLATPAAEFAPALSPDGGWVAYVSDEAGTEEVYLRRFPSGEGKRRVSRHGGSAPHWSRDGREILFGEGRRGSLVSAPAATGPLLTLGELRQVTSRSVELSWGGDDGWTSAVSPDGRRFLLTRAEGRPTGLVVAQNWFEEVRRLTAER